MQNPQQLGAEPGHKAGGLAQVPAWNSLAELPESELAKALQ